MPARAARKILALPAAVAWCRAQAGPVVFTNGVFDLLHAGHVALLESARALGGCLIIGLNSDASVRRLDKGAGRPIVSEAGRATVLAALEVVDAVVLFDDDTPLALIEAFSPDVLVKGGDYTRAGIVGADWVEAHGGRVAIIPLLPGYSTTALVEQLRVTS
jgi:D-beta-D-heptose 7-phosphate kinase/D-beta-D-heptose 1-phosphate adenosyltransferase